MFTELPDDCEANRLKRIDDYGWAKVSHLVTFDNRLSDGAYRTYAVIIRYWSQHKRAWIGISRLAEVRGVNQRTAVRHVRELLELKLIIRQRRMGMTSLTKPGKLDEVYGIHR